MELLTEEATQAGAERGLLRLGPPIAPELERRLREAAPPLRGLLVRVLGQLAADDESLVPSIVELSRDDDPRARRQAIVALGKLRHPAIEPRLVEVTTAPATSPPDRRSAVEALGKIGGTDALAAVTSLPAALLDADPELARLAGRARVRLERTLGRGVPSGIDPAVAPERALAIVYTCRTGLEELLVDELPGARIAGPGRVRAILERPLASVFDARLFVTFGFPLAPRALTGEDLVPALVDALASDEAAAIFGRFTRGPIRYRLSFAEGGHRRAAVLRAAIAVAERRPELVNDPTGSTWDAQVGVRHGKLELTLSPRLPDPRFAYREKDVPAASHPTVAAALARVAGARPDDVVWDPFVGSGTELIERALRGPYRALHGTDIDARALEAATANLAAAGHRATLERRDALAGVPRGTTLILTNPPQGRRLLRHRGAAGALLARLLDVAAPTAPRIAWVSPAADETAAHATRAGYRVQTRRVVDLGGYPAELQLLIPTSRRRPST